MDESSKPNRGGFWRATLAHSGAVATSAVDSSRETVTSLENTTLQTTSKYLCRGPVVYLSAPRIPGGTEAKNSVTCRASHIGISKEHSRGIPTKDLFHAKVPTVPAGAQTSNLPATTHVGPPRGLLRFSLRYRSHAMRTAWILPILAAIVVFTTTADAGTNCSAADATKNCIDGMIIPIWRPYLDLKVEDRVFRGAIYFFIIAYCFLGVSIVADRFMSSIEVITSMERSVTVKRPGLEPMKITVRIWNDTVSNLTLMALGSSAPEILLSIIEVIGKGFEAGDLGPNTIVGSAAFNLFMIIAICVVAVPSSQVRRQKHLDVFFVTATWSVFAYIWLYLILSFFSPGEIEIWEGLLTFIFFPLTVGTAYITDKKIIQKRFLPRRYRRTSHGLVATQGEELKMLETNGIGGQKEIDPAIKAFEEHRAEFIETMREIRKKNPHIDPVELQKQAEYEMITRGPKTRAFYRVQATRKLIGGGDIVKKRIDKEHNRTTDVALQQVDKQARQHTCKIYFDPAHYTVLENVGTFDVVVGRDGGPEGLTVIVDYCTEDGTANEGSDYLPVKGTLTFYPEDKHQKIAIEIVDDDVFEEDEHFYLHLRNLRVRTKDGLIIDPSRIGGLPVAEIETPSTATIMILDDDHAGVYTLEHDHFEAIESCGHLSLRVQRNSGARGKVVIPYKTKDGTATGNVHFEHKEGELVFEDNQTEAFIEIGVIDTEQYERCDYFFVELGEPVWAKKMSDLNRIQERFQRRMEKKRAASVTNLADSDDAMSTGVVLFSSLLSNASLVLCARFGQSVRGPSPFTFGASLAPSGAEGEGLTDRFKRRLSALVGGSGDSDKDSKENTLMLTQQQIEIAELGKPRLGQFKKCQITIKESKEFQSIVDRMLKTANTRLMLGTSSWREQFSEALTVSAGDDDDDGDEEEGSEASIEKEEGEPSTMDYVMHIISVPWKLMFATIPPTDYWGGWACFVVSIVMIGVLTALIGDLASQFGCWVGLKDAVTAITFVALGTSVPDTFASKVAAIQDKYADSSIGNVTGSNGVNVFLGIGIAWTLAALYHASQGTKFLVNPGTLAFSVTVFCVEAVICITLIVLRRQPWLGGGELGGPVKFKVFTAGIMVCLWLFYVGISALESYCVIAGF
ncbi:hypothetical protein QR680_005311 [Steinernema hermaphroditum]|uniref:Calx-beta domain-containing protein n=1 Tax=Steinernema hermaphroditum TaxID=289476 RepID=A0AA39HTS2_9BILA|nr:hypothetical protein QR680_005311 [Steinernema hermaphroditum]